MNYLAHLFLTPEKEEAKLGGLLGDFVKGNEKEKYSIETQIEIQMHSVIDFYTDSHSIVINTKQLVAEKKRRYMGILIDVFYDHMLAKNWTTYSHVELTDFTKNIYSVLARNKHLLPAQLNEIIPMMIEQDWLTSYRKFSGFESAIHRISKKLKKGDVLIECISDIENNYQLFSSGFDIFFPQLIDYVYEQRKSLNTR